ncbi:Dynein light chain Tctex-type 1 (Activator of G-protein signaling 2) (AGS2) (T-complex testis-specific protein 1) (TCTEX-1) [Durusdinium trenchii]|uniref:Dynein light chain Tctex-type 1 (Activator of G-protein signaling 2) (AGS2) (T-complex testis-specific protein 1) (TCTEX-1) n=1 Tax=Durusdinium trenchii TaxID=1381693 RepID=A0ABP0N7P9_9DINO
MASRASDEAIHSAEEIDAIVKRIIQEVLGEAKEHRPELTDVWCDQILERSLKEVSSLGRPFKYMATCVISRQPGQLDTAATAFWDTQFDCLCCTRLGNGRSDCIVTVYACRRF